MAVLLQSLPEIEELTSFCQFTMEDPIVDDTHIDSVKNLTEVESGGLPTDVLCCPICWKPTPRMELKLHLTACWAAFASEAMSEVEKHRVKKPIQTIAKFVKPVSAASEDDETQVPPSRAASPLINTQFASRDNEQQSSSSENEEGRLSPVVHSQFPPRTPKSSERRRAQKRGINESDDDDDFTQKGTVVITMHPKAATTATVLPPVQVTKTTPQKRASESTSALNTPSKRMMVTTPNKTTPLRSPEIVSVAKIVEDADKAPLRLPWTHDEVSALLAGVEKHGAGNWKKILTDPQLRQSFHPKRNTVHLKDKYRNEMKRQGLV